MTVKSSISAKDSAMSAALERVRPMLVALGGPRSWDDTKDHWRNKLARKVGINARRLRAILSKNEDVRLSADEYLSIEAQFQARVAELDRRLSEDLQALDGTASPPPSGASRAGGAPDSGAYRPSSILAPAGQGPDGRSD